MKWLLWIIGILIVIVGLGYLILVPRPLAAPESVTALAELETYLTDLTGHNEDSPPGLSLVVVKEGEIVYENGFGFVDPANAIPATADTVYNYWSLTKPFTAVAILQLQEQELLDIDDPVRDYLPYFDVQYPATNSEIITIRHLLNHSSGLRNNVPEVVGWVHTDGDDEWDQNVLLETKLPDYAKLTYEPGSQGIYTNVGYLALAAIIESVSGQTYRDYMRENIFGPLGMNHTDLLYTDALIDHEAAGAHPLIDIQSMLLPLLVDDTSRLIAQQQNGVLWFNHIYSDQKGATGIIGSPIDMAMFMRAYLNEGEWDGVQILTPESIEIMTNDAHVIAGRSPESAPYDDVRHGISWFVLREQDRFFIEHRGGGPGFATGMRLYPEENLGVVLMSNGTYTPTEDILNLVARLDW